MNKLSPYMPQRGNSQNGPTLDKLWIDKMARDCSQLCPARDGYIIF